VTKGNRKSPLVFKGSRSSRLKGQSNGHLGEKRGAVEAKPAKVEEKIDDRWGSAVSGTILGARRRGRKGQEGDEYDNREVCRGITGWSVVARRAKSWFPREK